MNNFLQPITSTHEYAGLKVTLTCREHTISEVLSAFEAVLKGAGYCFRGELNIIDEEGEAGGNLG